MDLWAMDEVHFQQHGSHCRMWVPPEARDPVLLHASTHKTFGDWGTIRWQDGKRVARREEGAFGSSTRAASLGQFYRACARSPRRVVAISDNVSHHHSRCHKERRAETFERSFLPAASPDLNPVEPVWKPTRRRAMHNQYLPML